ncbi:MAG: hypothetical protein R2797_02250 [Gelidibacter sp.]
MSKELPKDNSPSEELDLIQIFNFIGNGIKNLFIAIGKFFLYIFQLIVFLIRTILDYFKIILAVVVVAFIAGYILEKVTPPHYKSEMLVKPYFDSKYQLVSNISYYNALIDDKNYTILSSIFDINEEEAKKLINFDIEPGPETKNDQIKEYDEFIKSIDSLRAQDISFEDFVDNRDLYNGEIFLIEVTSLKKDIFKQLEPGFYGTFENKYAIEKKRKRDSLLQNRKETYLRTITDIDSLQKVYIDVLKEESKNKITSFKINEGLLPLQQDKRETKEFELMNRRTQMRDSISSIDAEKIEEDSYFDIVSGFQNVGTKSNELQNKYTIILPIASFIILCLIFIVFKTIKFVRNYES